MHVLLHLRAQDAEGSAGKADVDMLAPCEFHYLEPRKCKLQLVSDGTCAANYPAEICCFGSLQRVDTTRTEAQLAPTPTKLRSSSRTRDSIVGDLPRAGTPRSRSSADTLLFLAGAISALS